ncbi:MAG: hypothetical protein OZ914_05570 [Anaerolineaceae bacterium]|jgi:hypothetical protein|nr:hypothetical protein [Anaerolineaceae bacterium]OQY90802.1 MAG: hypothetical protein B6D38_03445 [Anaerolineae bacterium UTCFX1]HRQ31757.1 hypothetical protein [Anaerolineales bacterium]
MEPGFRISYIRIRFSLITAAVGLFVFIVGAKPNWFGWDRSPVVGFIQIAVFLIGLAMICVGGYVGLLALWGNRQRSILADIGSRLVSTGYVIAVFTGMADIFGLGTQPLPMVPYFGPWQSKGVLIGQIVIVIGLLMMVPYRSFVEER